MSKGSPTVRFRLPPVEHELLATLAHPDSPGNAAKRIVLDWLEGHAGGPLTASREHKLGEATSSEGGGDQEHLSSAQAASPADPETIAGEEGVEEGPQPDGPSAPDTPEGIEGSSSAAIVSTEDHLTRMKRLRSEWYTLEAQFPAQAREYENFDDYVRKNASWAWTQE